MPLDTADAIFAIKDRKGPHVFKVDAWGEEVYLRDPSIADLAEWECFVLENKGKLTSAAAAKMAQIFLCNASGERIVTPDRVEELNQKKSPKGMMQIYQKCVELLTISEAQVEALEGNSAAGQ